MKVRLTQIDGKLPNLALMKLAHWHKAQGDEVFFTRHIEADLFEPRYDRIYGSAIFTFSTGRVRQFQAAFPDAIVGGTYNLCDNRTVEDLLGLEEYEHYDYSILPHYRNPPLEKDDKQFLGSIGFTQRGCRLRCGFCVVPKKEGKARSVNSIYDIWRGEPWPRHLHLLDNDFFGQPREHWQARLSEILSGKFSMCLNQGINTRMIDDESAEALGSIVRTEGCGLYDDSFSIPRLYTAWDNLKDEERFFRGVDTLERHGIPPSMLLVYMLIGYDPLETWERLFHRLHKMVERQILPYPMIYERERKRGLPLGNLTSLSFEMPGTKIETRWLIEDPTHPSLARRTLQDFQRWAIRKYYRIVAFDQYDQRNRHPHRDWGKAALAEAAAKKIEQDKLAREPMLKFI